MKYDKNIFVADENAPVHSKRIAELCNEYQMTQGDLAKKSELSAGTISTLIFGKKENGTKTYTDPRIETIKRVSKALETTTDYLLGLTDVKRVDEKMQVVADVTGLSEKAIDKLQELNKDNKVYWLGDIVNSILESNEFTEIVVFLKKAVIEQDTDINYGTLKMSTKDFAKFKAGESFNALVRLLETEYKDFLTPYRYNLGMSYSLANSLYKDKQITEAQYRNMLKEFDKGNFDMANMDLKQIRQTIKEMGHKNG